MPMRPGSPVALKLDALFPSAGDRLAAAELLSRLDLQQERERVLLAVLKLAGADLKRLRQTVEAALGDYRDVLAWAESPRQMKLGPSAPLADQAAARTADAAEYRAWLEG